LLKWCQLISDEEARATDIQYPPPWATDYIAKTGQRPRWYRPGPVAEARLLGRFPSQAAYSVWSDADWQAACRENMAPLELPVKVLPEIGIDVARWGDDNTAFHVRCGPCSISHEEFNGQDTVVTSNKAKELARKAALFANKLRPDQVGEKAIPIKVDDSGVGGAVTDILKADGYNVTGINAATKAIASDDYPIRRDELWFEVAERARLGELDLSRLPEEIRERLGAEAMVPIYTLDSRGRRVVEKKEQMKKRTPDNRSPDGMDAVNLAYAAAGYDQEDDIPSAGPIKGARLGLGIRGDLKASEIIADRVRQSRNITNPIRDTRGDPGDL
jgi:hypothetical protein